ncbi:uncharacterized protein LOC133191089 [Saccostrea echinata]|uniref:uncharacterized protein LOC133191089 n=1 Tax=Saccostrea echinata TaxID=191078 RepID=UPI002A8122B9|nr:uncharacterized protein LOC133191089 [Saccostrea echinata]XP_061182760.1 uncharacterized protein LOC133191089 [Saccostrea echinata]
MNSVHVYEELVSVHQDADGDPEFTLALASARQDLQQHRKNMHPGYYFVGDNVDLRTKVRSMTITNQNKDQHMFQICAYENRVSGNHLDNSRPKTNIDTYNFKHLIPSEHEKKCLLSETTFLVAQQWSKFISHFLPYINVLPKYISHEYLKEMKSRTNRINLGVLMKCEQYNEDMTDICEFLHTFIPGHETNDDWQKKPDKVLSGGDYLTFERHKQAQSSKRNGRTPSKRLQGLIPKMEEFHNQAELLKVTCSQLYNTSSARNQGTLYAARNTLNSRNVTQQSSQDFYACSDLVEKVTTAYIVTGGLQYFGMDSLNSVPTKNIYNGAIGDKKEMYEYILVHASEFAKRFCVPDTPLLPEYGPQSNSLICRYCNKEYKRPKSLRKHEAKVHGHPDPLYGDTGITEITTQTSEDGVFNYTRLMLNLGLLRMNHNDAIRMGDGEHIMRINQFLVLFYKACNCPKYAYGLLETIAQTKVLLTERMAHRLIWNRTVNHRGEWDSNHPNDLDIEHCNKVFKDEAHSFRGTFTEKTVSRVSRSALSLQSVVQCFDTNCHVKKATSKHTAADFTEDILKLVEQYQKLDLFSIIPGRQHDPSFQKSKIPLFQLDMDGVRNWISASLSDYKRKHFYG